MEFIEASQTAKQEKTQQQQQQLRQADKDQAAATHDVTDRKKETDESALVEAVSLVEEEVKISAVVEPADAAVSEAVEETSSLVVETTSELQPLENVSLQELSSLIDSGDSKKGVAAGETNEEKAVPPNTSVNTNTAVDVGETKDARLSPDKLAKQEAKEKKDAKDKEEDKDDLNDLVQADQDASAKKDDAAAAAANEAPDHADASPAISEDMDIEESVKSTVGNNKKESAKEKQSKGRKSVKTHESEDEDEMGDYDMMDEEYEVEKIAGHRVFKGKVVKYIVKWKGYPSSENTTENATTMHADVPELCAAYWATCKEKRPDNVPHVAPKELKPLLETDAIVKDNVDKDNDESDDDLYKPETKARSPSPVAAISPAVSVKADLTTLDEEEEPPAKSRKATPAPSSFTTAPSDSTTPKQPSDNNNKRKRATSSSAPEPPRVKKFKKNLEHVPDYMVKLGYQFPTHWPNKTTEWDVDAKKVCVQASPIDSKVRLTYLEWNNGEKTIHTMKEAHEMIPEKLIHYYEERLQFV
ncbi:unnamed protein product [Mucor fragilis]